MIPYEIEILDPNGRSQFAEWFETLNAPAAAKVAIAVTRLAQGNSPNVKAVGRGVSESKINFGPGYRIYFGKDGDRIIILLGGGTKQGQQDDIRVAIRRWEDYKRRKQ